jgi:hypothetical protein
LSRPLKITQQHTIVVSGIVISIVGAVIGIVGAIIGVVGAIIYETMSDDEGICEVPGHIPASVPSDPSPDASSVAALSSLPVRSKIEGHGSGMPQQNTHRHQQSCQHQLQCRRNLERQSSVVSQSLTSKNKRTSSGIRGGIRSVGARVGIWVR